MDDYSQWFAVRENFQGTYLGKFEDRSDAEYAAYKLGYPILLTQADLYRMLAERDRAND